MPNPQALEAYQSIIVALKERNLTFIQNDEKLLVEVGFSTDDLNVDISLFVDEQRSLIRLFSLLPFKFSANKRVEGAVAICAINDKLVNGSFDYNLQEGHIFFLMSHRFSPQPLTGFRTSHLRPVNIDAINYLLYTSVDTIDEYDDLLLNLASGSITLDDFINKINE